MGKKEQILRKGLLVGVGVAAYAHKNANKIVKELLKQGHISRKEGEKVVRSVAREAQISGKRVAKVLEKELMRVLKVAQVKKPKKTAKRKKAVKKKK